MESGQGVVQRGWGHRCLGYGRRGHGRGVSHTSFCSQGDRGFDGQSGPKGDQGEKGERVS